MSKAMLTFLFLFLSGCTTSNNQANTPNEKDVKTDPYADSVLNSIKENQNINREQQLRKPY